MTSARMIKYMNNFKNGPNINYIHIKGEIKKLS